MTERKDDRSRTSAAKARAKDDTSTMERPPMDAWSPANVLDMPKVSGEYALRWIAEYVNGVFTPRNVQAALREGYVRVNQAEFLEEFICDENQDGSDHARTGGFVLMKIPTEFADQRRAYYARRSANALEGANTLQGVAGTNAVYEDRGTKTLSGADAGAALRNMSNQ